jgi:ribonuclease BN (tRNA processing enzyme)
MKNIENKIVFLGTGGGGSMVSLQKCATAGFWANVEGVNIYFDPGPGTMWHLRQNKLIPDDLRAVLVTHCHVDHTAELNALIESVHYQITRGGWNFKDYQVFVPPDVYREGYLNKFHYKMPGKVIIVGSQKEYRVKHLVIKSTKLLIEKPYYKKEVDEFGYQVTGKKYNFAYIPETFYKKGMLEGIKSETIILNAMKPEGKYLEQTVKIIKELSPKIVLLRHWVNRTLEFGPKKLAKILEKKTGVKVIALKDGDVFDLTTRKISKNET